jgi:hypothetical protein
LNSESTEVDAVSTFAQRFEYARARQHVLGTWREDSVLAAHLGIAASQITDYKARDEAPPAKRTLAIAQWCGVDPGWLAFGADSAAPAPEGFEAWLAATRQRSAAEQEGAATGTAKRGAKQSRGTPAVKSTDVRKRA